MHYTFMFKEMRICSYIIVLTEVFGTRSLEPVTLSSPLAIYDRSLLARLRWASCFNAFSRPTSQFAIK